MRRSSLDLDIFLGLEFYALEKDGIGGSIRRSLEDFIVKEIGVDGLLASPECDQYVSSEEGYWWAVLEKRGIDTVTALRIVARWFSLGRNRVSVAGLKDTRAVTFQYISFLDEIDQSLIEGFNAKYSRVKLHCLFRRPFYLRPGMLYGNFFSIIIREVENPENLVPLVEELKEKVGVPNYYGYQRFGTIRPNTHIVGKLIIQRKYKEAVMEMLLRIFPEEKGKAVEARRYLNDTWDIKGALEMFPKTLHHERHVLRYLLTHPEDYYGAIRSLPLYIRRLFIGAYQAYLFNKILSRRIEKDLSYVYAYPGDVIGIYSDDKSSEPKGLLRVNDVLVDKVNKLIREDKAALLLPIVGYRSQLSRGVQGEIEREVLKEEGVDLGDFYLKEMPEISSSGTFRRACMIPKNLTHTFIDNKTLRMEFSLRKGMYATVLLREFIKPKDLIGQGF